MRVVGAMEYGEPEVLQVAEVPERHAGPGQMRIRVTAAAVNPTDTYVGTGARAEMQKADPPPYEPGQTLAVTGAAGCYGGYVVQLAKADGLRVIADASPADEQLVQDLGADVVVPRGDDVAARIRAVVPEGVDGLADGAVQNELLLAAVKDGGGFATVRGWNGPSERGITIHPVWVRSYLKEQAKLDRLRQQVEEGAVTLRVAGTFPAAQTAAAHRQLAAGGTRGRLV